MAAAGSTSASGPRRHWASIASPSRRANSAGAIGPPRSTKTVCGELQPCWSKAQASAAMAAAAVRRGRRHVGQALGANDRQRQLRPENDVFRAVSPRQIDDRLHRLAASPGDADVGQPRKFAGRRRGPAGRHRRPPSASVKMRPLSVSPWAFVYVTSDSAASRYGSMPGRFRETFTRLAFLHSMDCTSESRPSTGTLPATQCTTRPRGWARTISGSFSPSGTKRSRASGRPRSERRASV